MKKKLLAMLLAAVLAVSLLPGTAFAADSDFVIENGVLVEYIGSGGAVTIPNSVTSIGESAFLGCSSLTSVTIPDTVTTIGMWAFQGCTGLTSVTIPSSVLYINPRAFLNCDSLTSINVASGNTSYSSVGGVLFYANETLLHTYPVGKSGASYSIPASVKYIQDSAFSDCVDLTSVTIPNGVTSIGDYAFKGCTGLTNVTIPSSVTSIGEWAFEYCSGLTGVTISNSVTTINKGAFAGCTGLTNVTIPNSVTSIGVSAFMGCESLADVTIPASVTAIGSDAFRGCSSLTGITIPASVTSIEEYAFESCDSLTSVTIPNGITSIEEATFANCGGLTSVTIPASVTSIGKWAFYECGNLKDVYYGGSESQWNQISIDTTEDGNAPLLNAAIHYPAVSFTDVNANDWYYKEVQWAVDSNITNGTGDGTTFSPKRDCTHEQILTFLYRVERGVDMAASSEDMDAAIEWAQKNGMIGDSFNRKALCTRADAVKYIWLARGGQSGADNFSFEDVDAGADYAAAVAWAVSAGITEGTNDTHFSPDRVCTRGHIVTFLYRAYVEPLSK